MNETPFPGYKWLILNVFVFKVLSESDWPWAWNCTNHEIWCQVDPKSHSEKFCLECSWGKTEWGEWGGWVTTVSPRSHGWDWPLSLPSAQPLCPAQMPLPPQSVHSDGQRIELQRKSCCFLAFVIMTWKLPIWISCLENCTLIRPHEGQVKNKLVSQDHRGRLYLGPFSSTLHPPPTSLSCS